jgi:hypothetical protein
MNSSKQAKTRGFVDSLRISASTMMWSMNIDVFIGSSKKIELTLVESSVSSRTENIEWEFSDPPYDLITEVGKFLIDSGDWRISGFVPVSVMPGTNIDGEFLAVCWCETEFEDVGALLTMVSLEQRASLHELFGGFSNRDIQAIAEPIIEKLRPYGGWEEIIDRFGIPDGLEWWKRVAAEIKQELIIEKEVAAKRADEFLDKDFGRPELVGNFEALLKKYRNRIPAGYLLHATKFEAPKAGEVSDALLMSWGRLKRSIPSGAGNISAQIGNVGVRDGDLAFAHWLLKDKKAEKLDRIREREEEPAKAVMRKLRRIADEGLSQLEQKPTSYAGKIGIWIAKTRVILDPDVE